MDNFKSLRKIGKDFWNIRSSFKVLFGAVDLGTQMSIAKLSSGKFVIIDTVSLTPEMKSEIDTLTNNGELIDSVVAVHPFHTLHFPAFYKIYPNAKYYGTPRHLAKTKEIPWSGQIDSPAVNSQWAGELSFEVTPCLDYETFPESHHASSVFAYHHASKTVHVDDTMTFFNSVPFPLWVAGVKADVLKLRWDLKKILVGNSRPDAMKVFGEWFEKRICCWDIDNAVVAHNGVLIGGANKQFAQCLKSFMETP